MPTIPQKMYDSVKFISYTWILIIRVKKWTNSPHNLAMGRIISHKKFWGFYRNVLILNHLNPGHTVMMEMTEHVRKQKIILERVSLQRSLTICICNRKVTKIPLHRPLTFCALSYLAPLGTASGEQQTCWASGDKQNPTEPLPSGEGGSWQVEKG